ncbi:hypothetical protein HK104_004281 [Borealophlyctis nickersoniae]|nr:hypothetical protein HK104_004281 [Borealophlyctis nickersoniae]
MWKRSDAIATYGSGNKGVIHLYHTEYVRKLQRFDISSANYSKIYLSLQPPQDHKPYRIIPLAHHTQITPLSNPSSESLTNRYEFSLSDSVSAVPKKDVHLAADSATERAQWVTALRMMAAGGRDVGRCGEEDEGAWKEIHGGAEKVEEEEVSGSGDGEGDSGNVAQTMPVECMATTDIETLLSDLTESMEMRTSRIAKMVDEVRRREDKTHDVIAAVESIPSKLDERIVHLMELVEGVGGDVKKVLEVIREESDLDGTFKRAIAPLSDQLEETRNHISTLLTNLADSLTTQAATPVTPTPIIQIPQPSADLLENVQTWMDEIRARLTIALSRSPSPSGPSGAAVDRHTSQMIVGINDKIIHVGKLIEHVLEVMCGRFAVVEEKLNGNGNGDGSNGDSQTAGDSRRGVETMTVPESQESREAAGAVASAKIAAAVRDAMSGIESRMARLGREGQTRHDVLEGRLAHIHESLMDLQRSVTANGATRGGREEEGDDELVPGNVPASHKSMSMLRKIKNDIAELKELVGDDATGARLSDLLGMIGIMQETQARVASGLETAANQRNMEEVKRPLEALAGAMDGLQSRVKREHEETKTLLTDLSTKVQRLSVANGAAPVGQPTGSQEDAHLLRLVESIHNCLVGYLPIDLDSKLNAIHSTVSELSKLTAPPHRITHASSSLTTTPAPMNIQSLLPFHEEMARHAITTTESLDSIQHTLARLVECLDGVGALGVAPPATMPAIDVTYATEIRDGVVEMREMLRRAINEQRPAAPPSSALEKEDIEESIATLRRERDALQSEIAELGTRKRCIAEEVDSLCRRRDALGDGEPVGSVSSIRSHVSILERDLLSRASGLLSEVGELQDRKRSLTQELEELRKEIAGTRSRMYSVSQ